MGFVSVIYKNKLYSECIKFIKIFQLSISFVSRKCLTHFLNWNMFMHVFQLNSFNSNINLLPSFFQKHSSVNDSVTLSKFQLCQNN